MDPVIVSTFLLYLIGMLTIGVLAYRRTAELSDYVLGGRRLSSFVTALSAQASDMSGWLLLGLPGAAYLSGLSSLWIALGLLVGTYLNWLIVARRLREQTASAGDSLTLSEFLENHFQDSTHLLRWVSGVVILFFFLIYTSSGLVAGGKLFEEVFGTPYRTAVVLGALVVISYTCLGGFMAVCWTDCIQGLLMLFALVGLPIAVIQAEGGWSALHRGIASINPELLDPWSDSEGGRLTWIAILSGLGWGLGYFGQPHILCRFMAIRSESEIPRARRMAMVWVILCMTGALLVGLAGIVVFADHPLVPPDNEKVFIYLVQGFLHPIPAGICLAAILAAIMSTADSQLLVSSSVLAEDFYRGLLGREASQEKLVTVGRGAVVGIALLATGIALDPDSQVLEMVAYAWAGFGAAFGPVVILSLFWQGINRHGALAGILTGGVVVVVWRHLKGGIFDLYEIFPGFLLSLVAIVAVSLITRAGRKPVA